MKKFYCVYQDGFFEFTNASLTSCLRFIAKKMGKRMAFVTVGEAVAAGYSIKLV